MPAYTPEFATQVIIDRLDGKAAQATTGSSTEPVVVALNYSGRCINDS